VSSTEFWNGLGGKPCYLQLTQQSAFEGTIRVLVGPDRVVFDVHRNFVCEESSFFKKAINGPFREAEKKEIELPFEEPHIFTAVMNWIYRKTFDPDLDAITWLDLAKLWIIADKLDIPLLQHRVIQTIFEKHWKKTAVGGPKAHSRGIANVSPNTIDHVYDNTRDDAALRHVLIALFVDSVSIKKLQERTADYPADFLADILGACWTLKMDKYPTHALLKGSKRAIELCTRYAPSTLEIPVQSVVAIHDPFMCDGFACAGINSLIIGTRYNCSVCDDIDFCSDCKDVQMPGHDKSHPLIELKTPIPYHAKTYCDGPLCVRKMNKYPIQGTRWICTECLDRDYCNKCKVVPTSCSTNHVLTRLDGDTPHNFVPTLMYVLGTQEYDRRREAGICVNCEGADHNTNNCIMPLRDAIHPDPED
jgi:hypothetical protein